MKRLNEVSFFVAMEQAPVMETAIMATTAETADHQRRKQPKHRLDSWRDQHAQGSCEPAEALCVVRHQEVLVL